MMIKQLYSSLDESSDRVMRVFQRFAVRRYRKNPGRGNNVFLLENGHCIHVCQTSFGIKMKWLQEPYHVEKTVPQGMPFTLTFWGTRSVGKLANTVDPMFASFPLPDCKLVQDSEVDPLNCEHAKDSLDYTLSIQFFHLD